jgi:transcriptional regulator with XRE-family HTH domain
MAKRATTEANVPISKATAKAIFKKQIYEYILERGWNNSDMARASGLSRDDIHRYVKGISFPSETKLRALAKTMKMEPEELLPNFVPSLPSSELSPASLVTRPDGVTWLTVNKSVSPQVGTAVMNLLYEDDKTHGSAGRR